MAADKGELRPSMYIHTCKTEARFIWPLWLREGRKTFLSHGLYAHFLETLMSYSDFKESECILRQLGWVEGIEECINFLEIIMIYEVPDWWNYLISKD